MTRDEAVKKIALLAGQYGGRAYLVGGCVRDRLMGLETGDLDVEVHGLEPETLKRILEEVGEPLSFGSSFGIYSLKDLDLDIAMPRKEHAVGRGHRDFEVEVDPRIGLTEAARRRDFTINALMEDILTGEIIDPFEGIKDIKAGIIRHIDDERFGEDPLRVLRAARFASRFGFRIACETVEICRKMPLGELSRERVEAEMAKALLLLHASSAFILRKKTTILTSYFTIIC